MLKANFVLPALAFGSIAAPASAISYFSVLGSQGLQPASFETLAVDFDNPAAVGAMIYTDVSSGAPASCIPGAAGCVTIDGSKGARPTGSTNNFLSTTTSGSRATFNFAGVPLRSVSFYAGTLDGYNIVEFLDASGALKATWTGRHDLDARFGGRTPSGQVFDTRIYFNFVPSDGITAIRFFSPVPAFEIDNIAVSKAVFVDPGSCLHLDPTCTMPIPASLSALPAVASIPEPATWVSMLIGFGFLGATLRGQRRRIAAV